MSIRWCCMAFHGSFEAAASRGISVHFDPAGAGGQPQFCLLARACDQESETMVFEGFIARAPLVTVSVIYIIRCPWCGVLLLKHYKKDLHLMIRPEIRFPRLF